MGQTQVACREYLRDGMGAAMTNIMDPLYALCAGTTEPSSVAITDPQAQRTPLTCGAVISDGSGVHALDSSVAATARAMARGKLAREKRNDAKDLDDLLRALSVSAPLMTAPLVRGSARRDAAMRTRRSQTVQGAASTRPSRQ